MKLYKSKIGSLKDTSLENTVDDIMTWSLNYFKDDLKKRPSLHKYVQNLPEEGQQLINKIGDSKIIINKICNEFKKCDIIRMKCIDEIYLSRVNKDNGGDQGLFDKHYDGTMRFINDAKVIRLLMYISSSGKLKVVFNDSKIEHNFKTYEYALLDFHNEYHWVEGSYDKNDIPRIILKLNYYICNDCSYLYSKFILYLNIIVFKIVKLAMNSSISPKTPLEKIIGWNCNFFRKINNKSPLLSLTVGFLYLILLVYLIYLIYLVIIKLFLKKIILKKKFLKNI